MSRLNRLISLGLALLVVLSATCVSFAGGSFNVGSVSSGSGSSGSHGDEKKEPEFIPCKRVMLGKVPVLIPLGPDDSEITQADDGSWVFEYRGCHVLCGEVRDVLKALRIKNVETGSVGDWSYRYGVNGGSVVFIASHKTVANVYVQGTAGSEDDVKTMLKVVRVVTPKEQKQQTEPKEPKADNKPRDPKAAK